MKNKSKTNKPKMSKAEKVSVIVTAVLLGITIVLPFISSFIDTYKDVSATYDKMEAIQERMNYDNDPPAKDENINATQADLSGYTYLEDENPALYEISLNELQRIFADGDEAVVYLSKTDCPYCQAAVIAVDDIGRACATPIYYLDLSDDISTEDYAALKELVADTLPEDSEGEKTFSIPVLFAVKDGTITGYHNGTVDGFVPGNQNGVLSEDQYNELMDKYVDVINSLSAEMNQNGSETEATATPDDGVFDEIQLKSPGIVEQGTGTVIQIPDIDYLDGLKEKVLDDSDK